VQLALDRAGHACLRDSDMQERSVGTAVEAEGGIERGDLLFFPRHVAIALDTERVVHATAHSMDVCIEPLAPVIERAVAESGSGLTRVRRI
ncbi:MAG: NlpC/P60 family protein, partial [Planctomycetota bacterium]|nr:NlpC/P60 family protein [Planctomycetota bacterium]